MKRTPLSRHKELQRWAAWNKKPRTRLKPRSPKYRAANATAEQERDQYLAEHPMCALCLYSKHVAHVTNKQPRKADEVHHLCGRNARACAKYERRKNWLSVCRLHHIHITDDSIGTAELCCAAKAFVDPENYDLEWLKATRPKRYAHVKEVARTDT